MDNNTIRKQLRGEFYRKNKGMMCIAVLTSAAAGTIGVIVSWIIKLFIDTASGAEGSVSLGRLALISAGFVAASVAVNMADILSQSAFIKRALIQYKEFAFGKLTEKSISTFRDEDSSAYLSALTNDAASIETDMLAQQFALISRSVTFAAAIVSMLYSSVQLTIIAAVSLILPLATSVIIGSRVKSAELKVSESNKEFTAVLTDCLNGFSTLKSFRAEQDILRLFSRSNSELESVKKHKRVLRSTMGMLGNMTGAFSQLMVFVAGTYLAQQHSVTAGTILMFINLMGNMIIPISELPAFLAARKAAAALADKLADSLGRNSEKSGGEKMDRIETSICLENVSFGYGGDKEVLHDISAEFEAGKSYAIVGGSGSGKSTLLDLLMAGSGNYKGSIFFDGNELREVDTSSIYDLISVIQQNVFVFNASVKDNITMFGDFARDTFERAVKAAHLDKLLADSGEDYLCGRNGCGLSGGEKQRISIARSLLKNSSVLLADEATAALDAKTAYQVSGEILDLEGITRIVVTHSLEQALLRRYDSIFVMKDGRIAERGNFDELMKKHGYFYALYTVAQ
ncbi:MAG: ABC transporter ATP-binding protein/permease [Oscillospiraceae bacterium]|nr:ABC transporter ATP-binding protein/permease [Oscillospiraceae bacterium]